MTAIKPLYIVGTIDEKGNFHQRRVSSGYTGTRAFQRLEFAQDFAYDSSDSCQIYKITKVEGIDGD